MDKNKRIVYLPIEVPNGDYCWDGETPCEFFSNEGGHGSCDISGAIMNSPDLDKEGFYPKPKSCLELSEFTDKIKSTIHPSLVPKGK